MPLPVGTCFVLRAAQGAGRRQQIWILHNFRQDLEKKRPARYEMDSDGRTGLQGMMARGWRTAPPQVDSEARLVTNSACPFPSEVISRGSESSLVHWACLVLGHGRGASSSGAAGRGAWTQPARSGTPLTAGSPLLAYAASVSRTLSATSVSGA
jgi:hypothetical protein